MESTVEELSRYRFETSGEALTDACIMFENGRYKNALNRAYYSIFHAIRAVNALSGFDSSKHSGVIAYFTQNYIKGTSKNYPFGFWPDLLFQQCALKRPQYIQYSGLSNTFVETKSLGQNLKKQFLEVA